MNEVFAQVFEAVMLVCFGFSWPLDIINTLRVKQSSGKSMVFMSLIVTGYVAGVAAKFIHSSISGRPLPAVTLLYGVNIVLVAADMFVTSHYRKGREIVPSLQQEAA